jgi:hypothetical protein
MYTRRKLKTRETGPVTGDRQHRIEQSKNPSKSPLAKRETLKFRAGSGQGSFLAQEAGSPL